MYYYYYQTRTVDNRFKDISRSLLQTFNHNPLNSIFVGICDYVRAFFSPLVAPQSLVPLAMYPLSYRWFPVSPKTNHRYLTKHIYGFFFFFFFFMYSPNTTPLSIIGLFKNCKSVY